MKKLLFSIICCLCSGMAQEPSTFSGILYNEEYKVFMVIDLYRGGITVPGQDIFGEVDGYLGNLDDSRKWLVTEAHINTPTEATLALTNDYGSEDLTATLSYADKEQLYILRQEHGSSLKVVINRKWNKLPKTLKLRRARDQETAEIRMR